MTYFQITGFFLFFFNLSIYFLISFSKIVISEKHVQTINTTPGVQVP